MKELALKYGCNPNQKPSRIFMEIVFRRTAGVNAGHYVNSAQLGLNADVEALERGIGLVLEELFA